METLESSRVCRLCGQHSGICINIFDKNENHVKKINAVLPILVHEMDLLPKQMCHRCSYKLEEFHKFYADCLKTDMDLKSQLSWMRKREVKEHIKVPMVQIENIKIKSEPLDYDIYELDPITENVNYINSMSPMTLSVNSVRNNNINSCRINDVNQHFTCHGAFANCTHCKCNYGKSTLTDQAALTVNCTNVRRKQEVKRDLNNSDVINKFKTITDNDIMSKDVHKERHSSSKEMNSLNIDNILSTNEVNEIRIKTEKPDIPEMRSLRPRKKTIDYLYLKRKKNSIIINPANKSKSSDVNQRNSTRQTTGLTDNKNVLREIQEEPSKEFYSRSLRPRKFVVNYFSYRRKKLSSSNTDLENGPGKKEVYEKCHKPLISLRESLSLNSGKHSSDFISNKNKFKVKQEILSTEEISTNEQENNEKYNNNGIAGGCVQNLNSLFGHHKGKLSIKVEKDNENENEYCTSSTEPSLSKSLKKNRTDKFKLKNIAAKQISTSSHSPKHLRTHDLRSRNGKMKKSEPNKLPVPNLKRKLIEVATTRSAFGRNLPAKIKKDIKKTKVPASLKNADNIKHFCEKCCTSFLNKELYMLHVCYFG